MITALAVHLEAVGAALVDAQVALAHSDPTATTRDGEERAQVQDALVALVRTSSDALAGWEREREVTDRSTPAASNRVKEWRAAFDELRVQVALAEMEVRHNSQDVLSAVGHDVAALEQALLSAGRDIGSAVTTLRGEVRRATHV